MKNYKEKLKMNRGFTLIELLIVISIIGVLTTIVMVAVGDSAAKARDAQRLADVRQLAFILEREAAFGHVGALTDCTIRDASTTACTGVQGGSSNAIKDYFYGVAGISDPAARAGHAICNPNIGIGGGPCHYGISRIDTAANVGAAGARTDNYQICFYLELDPDGDGHLVEGINSTRTGGRLRSGCL